MDYTGFTRKSQKNDRLYSLGLYYAKWIGIVICLLVVGLFGTQLEAQNTVSFSHGGDQQIQHGNTLEIPLIAQNVENLQSIQFNVHFNPHIIKFLSIQDLDTTSGIFPENIGLTETEEGRIFFVAIAGTTPIELADGDTLCVFSFEANGTPGSTSLFGVQGYPLELQAFDGAQFLPFSASQNFISIGTPNQAGYTYSICPNQDSSNTYDLRFNFFGDTVPNSFSFIDDQTQDTLFNDQIFPDSSLLISNVMAGSYLAVLSSNMDSILQSDSLVVSNKDEVSPTFVSSAASCPQIPDGRLELPFIEGGNPPYTVIWPDSSLHFRSFDRLLPGFYSVVIMDQDRCQYSFEVEVSGPEAIVQENIEAASCETSEDGSFIANVINLDRFEDSTLLFSLNASDWFQTEFLQVISLPAGPFTYFIQDTSGCIYTQELLIPFDNTIQLENINQIDPRCFGTNDGLVSATARLDILRPGNFNFNWSGPNPSVTDSFFLAVGLSPDSFILEVTHTSLPASCFDRQTVVLEDTDSLILEINNENESCFGQNDGIISITPLGGNPPYTFDWADGSADSLRTGLPPGSYAVEVNDANFCSQSADITIDTGFLLSWNDVVTQDLDCPGQDNGMISFRLDTQYRSNISLSYQLEPNGLDTIMLESLEGSISNLPGDSYQLTVFSSAGCSIDTLLSLGEPGPIIIDSFEIISGDCNRENAKIDLSLQGGNGGPFSYDWSDGSIGSSLDSVLNGQYMVTVTDLLGCIDSFTFDIPTPPSPVIDTIQIREPICFGDTTALISLQVDPASSYSFAWSTGDTTPVIEPIPAGLFFVTITSERNCKDTIQIEVDEPDPIQIDFETEPETAGQADGSARAIVSGGTDPFSFFWNTTPIQTEAFAQNLSAGVYEVLVIDANNCRASDTISIGMITSVEAMEKSNHLVLWPNPSAGRFYLENKNSSEENPLSIEVRDNLGKFYQSEKWPLSENQVDLVLPSSGLYYIHVLYNNGVRKVIPVIVQQ